MVETNGLPDRIRPVLVVPVESRTMVSKGFANHVRGFTCGGETCEIGLIQETDNVLDGRYWIENNRLNVVVHMVRHLDPKGGSFFSAQYNGSTQTPQKGH